MINSDQIDTLIKGGTVRYSDGAGVKLFATKDGELCWKFDTKDDNGWNRLPSGINNVLHFLGSGVWGEHVERRDWEGALEWLKEGKKVRRGAWQAPCWLVQDSSDSLQWQDETCARPDIYVGYYRFYANDFESTDWEIFE
jgi:hypothetical protein